MSGSPAVTVRIPGALRPHTGERAQVEARGATVGEALRDLVLRHPALRDRLLDEGGALRRHVSVFVNDEDVRLRQALDTPLGEGDRLALVPALAGG